eukprot:scaffold1085_cov407-Prasinococcus_capsulatus_cf.AAC.14
MSTNLDRRINSAIRSGAVAPVGFTPLSLLGGFTSSERTGGLTLPVAPARFAGEVWPTALCLCGPGFACPLACGWRSSVGPTHTAIVVWVDSCSLSLYVASRSDSASTSPSTRGVARSGCDAVVSACIRACGIATRKRGAVPRPL